MSYAILRLSKLKNLGMATSATQHNYRLQDSPNADPDWAALNHGHRNYWHLANECIAELHLSRLRSDAVRAVELMRKQTLAKWQRQMCHTGRRTFATLALEQGLRPELVMKITGHKSWASFKRYVNITADVVSREFHRVYGGEGRANRP